MINFYSLEDECGPNVEERLTNIVNGGIWRFSNESAVIRTKEKYKRPVNCYNMCTPRVNEPIWDHLRKETRWEDMCVAKMQSTLLKALIPSIMMANACETLQNLALLNNSYQMLSCWNFHQIVGDSYHILGLCCAFQT